MISPPRLTAAAVALLVCGGVARAAQQFVMVQDSGAGAFTTAATGINDSGHIVGYFVKASASQFGFGYSGGSYTTIDVPTSAATTASGISNGGQVTGTHDDASGGKHGFVQFGILGAGTLVDEQAGIDNTSASRINSAGTIVGSNYGTNRHGFVGDGGTATPVNDPLGVQTIARGIDSKGDIAGPYVDGGGVTHGFVDLHGTFQTVDDSTAGPGGMTEVFGVNDQLQVVGYYVDPSGVISGFNANVAEPATLALFVLASLSIVTLKRQRGLAI